MVLPRILAVVNRKVIVVDLRELMVVSEVLDVVRVVIGKIWRMQHLGLVVVYWLNVVLLIILMIKLRMEAWVLCIELNLVEW